MPPSFKEILRTDPSIHEQNGLFYQQKFLTNTAFEQHYTKLRHHEGRLYENEVVRNLPEIDHNHPLRREWEIRSRSTEKLIRFLRKQKPGKILEVGCGNGWLIQNIRRATNTDCCGVDVNETELRQAVDVFGGDASLSFLYADITSDIFNNPITDVIVIASALQYFPDPGLLIKKLQTLLNPGGTIHIIDTPFYQSDKVQHARARSEKYFAESAHADMKSHYFHHTWDSLRQFDYKILHNPNSLLNKLKRSVDHNSPFPWIIVKR